MADVSSKPLFPPLVFIRNSITCCLSFARCSHSRTGTRPSHNCLKTPFSILLKCVSPTVNSLSLFKPLRFFLLPRCSFHLHFLRPSWRTTHHLIRGFCYTWWCSSFLFAYVTSLLSSEPYLSPNPSSLSLSSSCFLLIQTNELTVTASKTATFWIPSIRAR